MRRLFAGILMVGLCSWGGVTGCAKPTPLDDSWGSTTRANHEAMVVNPGAGQQAAHEGIDPRSAEHVLDNYSKGQKSQEHAGGQKDRRTGVFLGDVK